MLDELHVGGAEGQREIRRQGRGDAEAASHFHDGVYADPLRDLHGGDVARTGQGAPQSNRAFESLVVVARRVHLAAADGGERRVHDGVKRRGAVFDRVAIHINLERAAHLADSLCGAVELGLIEAVSADHGLDFAGGIINRHERRLRRGQLLEPHARDAVFQVLDMNLREVPHLE